MPDKLTIDYAYYTGTDSNGQSNLDTSASSLIDGGVSSYTNLGSGYTAASIGGDLGEAKWVSRIETSTDTESWSNFKILYNSTNGSSGWTEVTNLTVDKYNVSGEGVGGKYLNQWNFDAIKARWWKIWATHSSSTGVQSVYELEIFSGDLGFVFTNPSPSDKAVVCGNSQSLQLTVTISGASTYDATFYDATTSGIIGTTISGVTSGNSVSTSYSTIDDKDYNWYLTATVSGGSENSQVYTFSKWESADKLRLTIDSSKVDEDLEDFPVLISLSSGTGITNYDATDVFDQLEPDTISGVAVSGTYDSYTKLLLNCDGDASDSQHIITANGNTKIYSDGVFNGSVYFGTGSDYLTIPDSSDWAFGSDDFTIDFWVKFETAPGTSLWECCVAQWYSSGNGDESFYIGINSNSSNVMEFAYSTTGSDHINCNTNYTPSANVWFHYAVVRNGDTLKQYINGEERGSCSIGSSSLHNSSRILEIGSFQSGASHNFNGNICELRISKGIARWTSEFDAPTKPYIADSHTVLLLHCDGDLSSSAHTITCNGNPQFYSSEGKFYGSYYFDGTGDYMTVPSSSDWTFGTNDLTLDYWLYIKKYGVYYFGWYNGGAWFDYSRISIISYVSGSTHKLYVRFGGPDDDLISSSDFPLNTWVHVAIIRYGSDFKLFMNGMLEDSFSSSSSINNITYPLYIGNLNSTGIGSSELLDGYMDEIRVSNGVARWTSEFITPSGPYGSSWDNRKKIAVTTTVSGVETQLYTEIERWDSINNKAWLWTKVPTILSGTDTTLYLYYDNAHGDNTSYVGDTGDEAAQNVWDDDFVGVWHMAQDPSCGSAKLLDSTSYDNNGDAQGSMTSDDLVSSVVGDGISFDGSDDHFIVSDDNSLDVSSLTVSVISKTTDTNTRDLVSKWYDGSTAAWDLYYYNSAAYFRASLGGVEQSVSASGTSNIYQYVTGVFNDQENELSLFLDGIKKDSYSDSNSIGTNTADLKIGKISHSGSYTYYYNDVMDEVRVSSTARSAGWIKADYYSVFNSLITFSEAHFVDFIFSDPCPADGSTQYGYRHLLKIIVTSSGNFASSYKNDITFYDGANNKIGNTLSGVDSGSRATSTDYYFTPTASSNTWYVYSTTSGYDATSATYSFDNLFLCSGYTAVDGVRTSGIPVRLYKRSDGELLGSAMSSGVSGTFEIPTSYTGYHYAVAIHPTDEYRNAEIFDWLSPVIS